jgi:hypothetical protein
MKGEIFFIILFLFFSLLSNCVKANTYVAPALQDAFVQQIDPSHNFNIFTLILDFIRTGYKSWAYVMYDLTSIPSNNVRVSNASACMYLYFLSDCNTDFQYGVYNTTNDWNETTVTWNNQPGKRIFQSLINNVCTSNKFYCWNVTDAVASAVRNNQKNVSFIFTAETIQTSCPQPGCNNEPNFASIENGFYPTAILNVDYTQIPISLGPISLGPVSISPHGKIAPGTTFYVGASVNDINGRANVSVVNISCVGTGGVEWTNSWDSIKLLNTSAITWTSINDTAYLVNGSFDSSVNYWTTKSVNGTWTCVVYASDTSGSSASSSATMNVDTSSGITISSSDCAFDNAAAGDTGKQWYCLPNKDRNNTITHNGNVDINLTIYGTNLVGENDSSWDILADNITWNASFSPDGGSLPGNSLSISAADLITQWNRGTSPISSAINITAWLNLPKPLKYQLYNGSITITSMVD